MKVWRLTRNDHVLPDGEGARLYGGRWNFPKTALVYLSGTLSLAVLEYLVHLDTDLIPNNVVSLAADLPTTVSVSTVDIASLPANWDTVINHPDVQTIGTAWVAANSSAILQVPSAIIPAECNFLLNPKHPDFHKITWSSPIPFTFDSRLLS
jgi:RES domain-containing protein